MGVLVGVAVGGTAVGSGVSSAGMGGLVGTGISGLASGVAAGVMAETSVDTGVVVPAALSCSPEEPTCAVSVRVAGSLATLLRLIARASSVYVPALLGFNLNVGANVGNPWAVCACSVARSAPLILNLSSIAQYSATAVNSI